MGDVTGAGQTLLQFGVDQSKIMPEIRMLGDVAAGSRERLQSLSLAYAQIQATGRLQGQDLMQLVNAGFNPLLEISKMTGLSMADLKKKMEAGAISAEMVGKAFEHATGPGGQFFQMTEKQSQTLGGKWSTFMDSAHNKVLELGQAFAPAASKALDFAIKLTGGSKTVAQTVQEETEKIYGLYGQLTSVNTSEADRIKLLAQLRDINPKITDGINDQSISYAKLAGNIANVTSALNQQAIAQQFRDDNAKLFTSYSKAQSSYQTSQQDVAIATAKAFALYPDVAANTSMSTGQKQLELIKRLQKEGYSASVSGSGLGYGGQSINNDQANILFALQSGIKSSNEAVSTWKHLLPQYNTVSQQIKTATGLANKGLGITDPVQENGAGKKPDIVFTPTTNDGKSRADSINSGGQRSIIINIAKQTGAENIYVGSNKEGANEIESLVREAMRRVLLSINGNAVSAS